MSKILAALAVTALLATCSSIAATQEKEKVVPLEGFPQASLTIFPVTFFITGPVDEYREFADAARRHFREAGRENADILGLLLEEKGYDRFEVTATDFHFPAEEAERKERAAAFGKFVSGLNLKTDYVLCTELTLHLERGFQEAYSVIVKAEGGIAWEDSQRRGHSEFDEDFPGTPLKCCELICRRLMPLMGLDQLPPTEMAAERRQALEQLRSGEPPSRSEFAAIEERLEAMKKVGGSARVIIYPTRLGGDHADPSSATHLSELLSETGLCRATVAQTSPVPECAGWPNEMEVLWRFARAARDYARQHKVDSDYVLFADYWIRPHDNAVHAVHFVVCERAGDWVIVDLQNSHHEDFQRVQPKTLADCDRLVMERFRKYLR